MRALIALAALFAAAACTTSGGPPVPSTATRAVVADATSNDTCPVTIPDGAHRAGDPAGLGRLGYGNGELWVGLWPHGAVRVTTADLNGRGEIVAKFPWDRAVRGRLRVTGVRLDRDGPSVRARLPDYGMIGFQSSAIIFPTEGCWRIIGTIPGHAALTFVTSVAVVA